MGISEAELEELKAEELRIVGERMVAQMFSQPQMTDETDEEDEDDDTASVAG
jgi:hypothetical protein